MSKNKNKSENVAYNTIKKIRGDWGNINPVTKIINNKKHEYHFPDSYYDYEKDEEQESRYDREQKIESTIDFDEWGEW